MGISYEGTNIIAEVMDLVLDKGIVIDARHAVVALVGVDILTVDARIVISSLETYVRHSDQIARNLQRNTANGLFVSANGAFRVRLALPAAEETE